MKANICFKVVVIFKLFVFTVDYIEADRSIHDHTGISGYGTDTLDRESVSPPLKESSPLPVGSSSSSSSGTKASPVGPSASPESGCGSGTSPEAESQPVRKKARTNYRPDQIKVLERQFQENPYPDFDRIETLSKDLEIPENKLKVNHKILLLLLLLLIIIIITTKTKTPSFLTFTNLWADSADDKLMIVFLFFFFQKTGFDTSCKLSPFERICMKCRNLFSEKNNSDVVC